MATPVIPSVIVVASGGKPRKQVSVASGLKVPSRMVASKGLAITLTTGSAPPVILYDTDGVEYVPA